MFSKTAWILALVLPLLAGCASPSPAPDGGHGDTVAWFDGTTDAAFALAKQENKPLFLYWGAEWCPPCHYLKTKIFARPEFVAKSSEFVAVYLDGDTERAQILGEELGAMGYPTVLIFSPDGKEIMRMPSDVEIDEYVNLLDAALSSMRPINDVLAAVMAAGPASAEPGDLSLLAYYSWGQDRDIELSGSELIETLKVLYEQTPEALTLERSRFFTMFLGEAISAASDDENETVLPAKIRAASRQRLLDVLKQRQLRNANLPFVTFSARETVEYFHPEPSPQRDELVATWEAAVRAVEDDATLAIDDRLGATVTRVWLATPPGEAEAEAPPALPAALLDHVRTRVAWAAEAASGDSELQAVMSTMAYLLEEAGLTGEAEALLTERLGDTHAPYYFMGWIAGMKADADKADEALAWYRKAYDNSRGRYSRFRWGSSYLRQLMKLSPQDVKRIESDSLEIVGELLTLEDAFAGGNNMRLNQLEKAYRQWSEDGKGHDAVARIGDLVRAECSRFPESGEDSQRSRCESFLIDG